MYAVIKTGGKQYRVQPGDVIVVEKLDGDAGAAVNFGEVLMLGGDKGVTVGAPLIDGAAVAATLVETRKGEKVKFFNTGVVYDADEIGVLKMDLLPKPQSLQGQQGLVSQPLMKELPCEKRGLRKRF